MRTIFSALFGRAAQPSAIAGGAAATATAQAGNLASANAAGKGTERLDSMNSIADSTESATRRQLLHVVLRGVMRRHGIPAPWIDCEVTGGSRRSQPNCLHLRLVIRHWDARLLHYAFALQTEVMNELLRFEPNAENWLLGVAWQLKLDGRCPVDTLPDKSFWLQTGQSAPQPSHAPIQAQAPTQALAAAPVTPQAAVQPFAKATAPAVKTVAVPAAPAGALPASREAISAAAPTVSTAQTVPSKRTVKPLAYGAPNFQASQPAEETELTDELARLFSLGDQESLRDGVRGLRPVGYEQTQPAAL